MQGFRLQMVIGQTISDFPIKLQKKYTKAAKIAYILIKYWSEIMNGHIHFVTASCGLTIYIR